MIFFFESLDVFIFQNTVIDTTKTPVFIRVPGQKKNISIRVNTDFVESSKHKFETASLQACGRDRRLPFGPFNFAVMKFRIQVYHDRKRYRFNVQYRTDHAFDYYKVIARNKSITLKNNAPVMRRHHLKFRQPEWHVHEGDIWNSAFKESLIEAISKYIAENPIS